MKQHVFLITKKTPDFENGIDKVKSVPVCTVSSVQEAMTKAKSLLTEDLFAAINKPEKMNRDVIRCVIKKAEYEGCSVYMQELTDVPGCQYNVSFDEHCAGYYNAETGYLRYEIQKVPFEEL